MEWKVEEIKALKGFTVEWAEPGNYILSRRNRLFQTTSLDIPPKHLADIEAPGWKAAASRFRLAQRLLRFMVTNVVPLANGELFITFDKSAGVVRDGKYRTLGGMQRPCRVLRSACAVDSNGEVFFGEYLANEERGPMRIYKYSPGAENIETAYTFPAGTIRHIHGIYLDPQTNGLICLTGDNDNECRIIRSDDGFRTMETIGEGDETWRAVSVLFRENSMVFGMDAEFQTNHIYEMNRETREKTSLGTVNGTVFYSKQIGDDLFFATTAEDAPSQTENVAAVWHVSPAGELNEITRFEKDGWHKTLFMFGTIHFPYGSVANSAPPLELYFHLVGVREDNRVYRLYSANRQNDSSQPQ